MTPLLSGKIMDFRNHCAGKYFNPVRGNLNFLQNFGYMKIIRNFA